MLEVSRVSDALTVSMGRGMTTADHAGLVGHGLAELFGPDGELKQSVPFKNLITTAGDQYFAQMGISTSLAVPTRMTGMKLGTGAVTGGNTPAKSGSGAASLATYQSGSNLVFDSTYPQATAKGGDTGWNMIYRCTWVPGNPAGTPTLTEAVIVNDASTNATSIVANTIARAALSPAVTKGASDTLTITWTITLLGA